MEVILNILSGILDALGTVAKFVWDYKCTLIALGAAVSFAVRAAKTMGVLNEQGLRKVGRPAAYAAVLFAIMLLASGYTEVASARHPLVPYGLSLGALLAAAEIWILRQPPRSERSSLQNLASSPAAVLLALATTLVLVLCLIEVAVRQGAARAALTGSFAGAVFVSGLLAMAIIQGIRGLLPIRGAFHRASLERWVNESVQNAKAEVDTRPLIPEIAALASASSGTERYAFFDLPIEQLCGQIAAGADRLLEDPLGSSDTKRVSDLLTCLTAGSTDVSRFIELAPLVRKRDDDKEGSKVEDTREYMRIRATLSQRIQRNVDRLQIDTAFWWRRLLRGLAFIISVVIGRALLNSDPAAAAVCGIAGGFVATVARDTVAIVEKVRR